MGPKLDISKSIMQEKYLGPGESFEELCYRIAGVLKDNDSHYHRFKDILLEQKFLPAGRIMAAIGSPRQTTAFNCFVSGTVQDDSNSIMDMAKEAFQTMRLGGGIGYGFSRLRPRGALIRSLDSRSSGPLSFMDIFNSVCGTVRSAGHRRGAQMGVIRIDHPDIEEFIDAKTNNERLTNFNVSVAVTDKFMDALANDSTFDLTFNNSVYKTVSASRLWDKIMRATWDWAEPGVLFIDRINRKNNLWYCEEIEATNPCGEQPLPPYGACLLGSFNLTKYIRSPHIINSEYKWFDYEQFETDIIEVVRAMDNVIDRTIYPLEQQRHEAISKRRMGLGVTGAANAIEILGSPYGSSGFLTYLSEILTVLRDTTYRTSIELSKEKGKFPAFDIKLLESEFAKTLPEDIRNGIRDHGLRNSHLLSIAPTGTISLAADNISSGIEPVFTYVYDRTIQTFDGAITEEVKDYAYNTWNWKGRTANEVSAEEHVSVLTTASQYVDSACSKTCNVGDNVSWESFKNLYISAYKGGASGCTTFRSSGKRYGILNAKPISDEEEGAACYYDPDTGKKTCE